MKKRKIGMGLGLSLLILTGVCYHFLTKIQAEEDESAAPESCMAVYDGVSIHPWTDGEEMYLFLPSYFVWEETELFFSGDGNELNGEPVRGGCFSRNDTGGARI